MGGFLWGNMMFWKLQLHLASFCLLIRGLQIFLSKDANGTSLTALTPLYFEANAKAQANMLT